LITDVDELETEFNAAMLAANRRAQHSKNGAPAPMGTFRRLGQVAKIYR
jgi:hypothetical protein